MLLEGKWDTQQPRLELTQTDTQLRTNFLSQFSGSSSPLRDSACARMDT
jgi:hypothetical protein